MQSVSKTNYKNILSMVMSKALSAKPWQSLCKHHRANFTAVERAQHINKMLACRQNFWYTIYWSMVSLNISATYNYIMLNTRCVIIFTSTL